MAETSDPASGSPDPQGASLSRGMTQLRIAEFESRLARFRQLADQQSQVQHWALLFSGAVWAWVLSQPYSETSAYVCWVPVAINALFYGKTFKLGQLARCGYKRLDWIMSELGDSSATKWERENWTPWTQIFWGVVMGSTAGLATLATTHPEWFWNL